MTEPKSPQDPGWIEALAKRREAGEAWLAANPMIALVIPMTVVRDAYPEGFDVEKFQPLLSKIMPGEIALWAEKGTDNVYVALKGS